MAFFVEMFDQGMVRTLWIGSLVKGQNWPRVLAQAFEIRSPNRSIYFVSNQKSSQSSL